MSCLFNGGYPEETACLDFSIISTFDLFARLAESSFALLVIYDCFIQLVFAKVGPEHVCEVQFCISTLEKQKIG